MNAPAVPRRAYVVLALAVASISFAAPLIRISGAHPLAIATWRLAIAMVVIVPMTVRGGSWKQWRTLTRGELAACVGAGIALALHFWSWNTSVGLTTIAASVFLVNLQPVVVATGSALWLGEPPSGRQWLGVAIAMIGAVVVVAEDLTPEGFGGTGRALLGDALAVLGAISAGVYYLTGRRIRQRIDLWPYVSLVYGVCLLTLLLLVAAAHAPLWPQPAREWGIFAALAAGPMLLGHTGMNWALKLLPAYVVNLTLLGEPVLATLLAMAIPGIGEVPTWLTLVGGLLILSGIMVTASKRP